MGGSEQQLWPPNAKLPPHHAITGDGGGREGINAFSYHPVGKRPPNLSQGQVCFVLVGFFFFFPL